MEFMQEIYEARMTRNSSNQRVLTYTDCCERLYLSVVILDLLRQFPKYAKAAENYAYQTTRTSNYKSFRISGTDLYNFIYFVDGDDSALNKLKDPGAAKALRQTTHLPIMSLNGYLTQIASGAKPTSSVSLFISLENSLHIANTEYKNTRRSISNFSDLSKTDKKKTVTRLLLAARAKLRSSDIIDDLEKLAVEQDFETGLVKDTEPTVSLPDITTSSSDIANYRYLVGAKNSMLAQRVVAFASKGASIPGSIIFAYLPIIKMVHDIVKAGPAYIQQLKVLHKRAQKTLKD